MAEQKKEPKRRGGKRPGAGRPVAPMRAKLQQLLLGMSEDYADALQHLRDTDPEAFAREYNKALPYVIPRLQTTKIETDAAGDLQVKVSYAKPKSK